MRSGRVLQWVICPRLALLCNRAHYIVPNKSRLIIITFTEKTKSPVTKHQLNYNMRGAAVYNNMYIGIICDCCCDTEPNGSRVRGGARDIRKRSENFAYYTTATTSVTRVRDL